MDFTILASTKVRLEEFGAMCGVNRSAVSHWVKGRNSVSKFNRTKVSKRLQQLQLGMSEGLLPIPDNLSQEERVDILTRVMKMKL